MSAYIEFRDVKKIYKMGEVSIEALAGVDFSIDKGEFVVIAGASGAGKSTILNILGGMDTASSGTIIVDGKRVSDYNARQLTTYRRYDIGFVFQFYNLVQNLTVRENVELATQICKEPLDIDETIEAVGLADRSRNFPAQLSGVSSSAWRSRGPWPKIQSSCFAMSRTGALDYQTGKQILKLLQDTCRQRGVSVIVITHNLALTAMGDKVIKVRSGRIDSVEINDIRCRWKGSSTDGQRIVERYAARDP